jgi:hypothetical protein
MYFDVTCPQCGKKHPTKDLDYCEDEESDNYRPDPHICWPCYLRMEDERAIKMISSFLDSLNEEQRDMAADLLEKLCASSKKECSLFGRIIRKHFRGSEGIKTWGLW